MVFMYITTSIKTGSLILHFRDVVTNFHNSIIMKRFEVELLVTSNILFTLIDYQEITSDNCN